MGHVHSGLDGERRCIDEKGRRGGARVPDAAIYFGNMKNSSRMILPSSTE